VDATELCYEDLEDQGARLTEITVHTRRVRADDRGGQLASAESGCHAAVVTLERTAHSDAAKLQRSKLTDDGKLFLYTQKTGQPVYLPLPPSMVKMLRELPNIANSRYSSGTASATPRPPVKRGGRP